MLSVVLLVAGILSHDAMRLGVVFAPFLSMIPFHHVTHDDFTETTNHGSIVCRSQAYRANAASQSQAYQHRVDTVKQTDFHAHCLHTTGYTYPGSMDASMII